MQRVAQILRLLDQQGRPCGEVTLAVVEAEGPAPEMAYLTGPDGRAQIGLPPGRAVLEATAPDGRRQKFSIEAAAEPGREHELRMS